MPTKIVRTVIAGTVIETPVEVPEPVMKKTPKARRGRPAKAATPEEPTPVVLPSDSETD